MQRNRRMSLLAHFTNLHSSIIRYLTIFYLNEIWLEIPAILFRYCYTRAGSKIWGQISDIGSNKNENFIVHGNIDWN